MIKILDSIYASSSAVPITAVQTQLFRMSFSNQDMAEHIHQYMSFLVQLERMGTDAAIPDTQKARIS